MGCKSTNAGNQKVKVKVKEDNFFEKKKKDIISNIVEKDNKRLENKLENSESISNDFLYRKEDNFYSNEILSLYTIDFILHYIPRNLLIKISNLKHSILSRYCFLIYYNNNEFNIYNECINNNLHNTEMKNISNKDDFSSYFIEINKTERMNSNNFCILQKQKYIVYAYKEKTGFCLAMRSLYDYDYDNNDNNDNNDKEIKVHEMHNKDVNFIRCFEMFEENLTLVSVSAKNPYEILIFQFLENRLKLRQTMEFSNYYNISAIYSTIFPLIFKDSYNTYNSYYTYNNHWNSNSNLNKNSITLNSQLKYSIKILINSMSSITLTLLDLKNIIHQKQVSKDSREDIVLSSPIYSNNVFISKNDKTELLAFCENQVLVYSLEKKRIIKTLKDKSNSFSIYYHGKFDEFYEKLFVTCEDGLIRVFNYPLGLFLRYVSSPGGFMENSVLWNFESMISFRFYSSKLIFFNPNEKRIDKAKELVVRDMKINWIEKVKIRRVRGKERINESKKGKKDKEEELLLLYDKENMRFKIIIFN